MERHGKTKVSCNEGVSSIGSAEREGFLFRTDSECSLANTVLSYDQCNSKFLHGVLTVTPGPTVDLLKDFGVYTPSKSVEGG